MATQEKLKPLSLLLLLLLRLRLFRPKFALLEFLLLYNSSSQSLSFKHKEDD